MFPKNHKDVLNELLIPCNIKVDQEGSVRNIISFIITYIMFRLIN
jgi:hypothetical protein